MIARISILVTLLTLAPLAASAEMSVTINDDTVTTMSLGHSPTRRVAGGFDTSDFQLIERLTPQGEWDLGASLRDSFARLSLGAETGTMKLEDRIGGWLKARGVASDTALVRVLARRVRRHELLEELRRRGHLERLATGDLALRNEARLVVAERAEAQMLVEEENIDRFMLQTELMSRR